jgi:hypothetical protein
MKRFINHNKNNYYNNTLIKFSDENRPIFTGLAKGYSTKRYKWLNDYLFKHRTNLATNSNIAYVSFFSDREMVYQEYGNISKLYNKYPFLTGYERQKLSPYSYELSSNQYRKIGQKNTDFDLIQFINASEQRKIDAILSPTSTTTTSTTSTTIAPTSSVGELSINHNYKYDPIFHAEGYRLKGYPNNKSKFIWADKYYCEFHNPILNQFTLNLSNFIINLGYYQSDIEYNSEQYIAIHSDDHSGIAERTFDYKIQVDHKNFFYFQNSLEWVVYYTRTESFNGNDLKPYFGALICYNENNEEITPAEIQYFPDVFVNGKIEPAKIIIKWLIPTSGKCAFNTGNVTGSVNDQSRLIFHICKYMMSLTNIGNTTIFKSVDGNVIYDGIDLDTERNKRHYATVMTEPYLTTKAINNGAVVNYKFIDRYSNDVHYTDEADYLTHPGMYLKIKCSLDTIKELDRLISVESYNTDIIDTVIVKNPKANFVLTSGVYYKNFNEDSNTFYRRQDDGVFDLLYNRFGEISIPTAKHANLVIPTWIDDQDNYYSSGKMKIAGIGYYTDTIVDDYGYITGENEYAAIYCTNYLPDAAIIESQLDFLNNPSACVLRTNRNEKFKPLLKLNGINGYIKILNKNKHFTMVQANDGQYEVVYNIEFPYCPGSHSERYKMDFSDGYQITQILYPESYISAGSNEISSEIHSFSDFTNDRYILENNSAFTYTSFAGSGHPEFNVLNPITAWYKNGGGFLDNGKMTKEFITYPNNRILKNIYPAMISSEISELSYLPYACNYQIITKGVLDFKDYQLFVLADNKKWAYDNKYESYIGRENPSYVFSIDATSLYNDYTKNQKDNAYMPDIKRWLYAYAKSFAVVNSNPSESDIVIDIWDQKSKLGPLETDRFGNWRSISPSQMDNDKVREMLILDSLYRYNTDPIPTTVPEFYKFTLGYYNPTFLQPTDFPSTFNAIDYDKKSNFILYDTINQKCYHVAYITYIEDLGNGYEGLEFTIKWDINSDPLPPEDAGPLQFFTPLHFINEFKNFELYSSKILSSISCGLYTKYIDIKKTEEGIITDRDRYVDDDNRIYFRVRINRNKTFPTTKVSTDYDELQFIRDVIINNNNPWIYLGEYNSSFDYRKISLLENVEKLGLTYFKLASI